MRRIRLGILVFLLITMTKAAWSATLYQTATLGFPGSTGVKTFVGLNQTIGTRFELTTSVHVTNVGGHFEGEGNIFGAIVALDDLQDMPADELASGVLGSTLIPLPTVSNDTSAPLDLLLSPGAYALVFGSGKFGATGGGMVPTWNPIVGWPVSIIIYGPFTTGWQEVFDPDPLSTARFFVQGEVIPEPAAAVPLVVGAAIGLSLRRKRQAFGAS